MMMLVAASRIAWVNRISDVMLMMPIMASSTSCPVSGQTQTLIAMGRDSGISSTVM